MTKQTVLSYNVTIEYDHEQYWQGHGIAFTDYDECATGIGDTPLEALYDCLESLAQNNIEFTPEQEADLIAEMIQSTSEPNDECDEAHFYVSIDVKLNN